MVALQSLFGERIDGLLGAVHAEGQFVEQRRAEGVDQSRNHARRADLVLDGQLRPARACEHEIELALERFVVIDAAPVELRPGADVPIHAKDGVAPRLVYRRLDQRVIGTRRIDGVGRRQHLQQRLPVAIDAVRRNAVARERRAVVQRIPDRDERAALVERVREVAFPLGRGREHAADQVGGILARQELLRPEEEQLLAVLVEVADGDRSAEKVARVVESVLGPRQPVAVPEELVGVERLVAHEVVGAAVELARCRP